MTISSPRASCARSFSDVAASRFADERSVGSRFYAPGAQGGTFNGAERIPNGASVRLVVGLALRLLRSSRSEYSGDFFLLWRNV